MIKRDHKIYLNLKVGLLKNTESLKYSFMLFEHCPYMLDNEHIDLCYTVLNMYSCIILSQ